MNCVLLVHYGKNYSNVLHNLMFIESRGSKVRKNSLKTTEDLIIAIEKKFAIPNSVSRIALEGLYISQEAWS